MTEKLFLLFASGSGIIVSRPRGFLPTFWYVWPLSFGRVTGKPVGCLETDAYVGMSDASVKLVSTFRVMLSHDKGHGGATVSETDVHCIQHFHYRALDPK